MEKFSKKQIIFLFILLLTYIFIFITCKYSLQNSDGRFHTRRMYDIFLSIKDGYLYSFLSKDLLNGFGYPTLGLYPYLLMIPFCLIQFLFSSETAYMVYMLFLLLFSFFTSYIYATENNIKNLFPIFYVLNPYLILIIHSSQAGMFAAYAIIPLIFLAIDKILDNKKNGTILLIISMTLVAYSHILSTIILTAILCIYVGINYKKLTKLVIKKVFIAMVICTCLCALIIFPTLEFLMQGKHGMNIYEFIGHSLVQIKYYSIVRIILIPITILLLKKKKYLEVSAILILVMCTNILPPPQKILNIIQFGNRMLIFSGMIFGLLICRTKKNFLYVFILTPITIFVIMITMPQKEIKYAIENPPNTYKNYVSLFDYVPQKFANSFPINDREKYKEAYEIFNEDKILSLNNGQYKVIGNTIIFEKHYSDKITLPRLFYKGYKVELNGIEIENYEGTYGMLQIDTNEESGTITIDYIGTSIQKISKQISMISFIILIAYIICEYTNIFHYKSKKAHKI